MPAVGWKPPTWSVPVAAVVVSDEDGRAAWTLPRPFSRPPVVTVAVVDPDPGDGREAPTVVLEAVEVDQVRVRVWLVGRGEVRPAGPGVRVHLTAVRLPPGTDG
ncbi:hypothetical protein [Streptomyces sp. H27-H5]|uniref:hypothetical protein n=1 Tax=Streptomyces sp. H27-H5 TaxID=2996460 RepID=UPI00226DDEB2|nr:hypothetical protein [Streptomyces sp. H27-H5]MCY0957753.1 hypothetical protein [Streptomyces sp. H27-H5]